MNFHSTRDSISEGAVKALKSAVFPSDHSAVCNCAASGGKMKPEDCDGLGIYDGDNAKVASFHGRNWRAQQADNGAIEVYKIPGKQTQDGTCCRAALVAMNRRNEQFWQRK
jgi:hypothetical protein